MPKRPDDYLLKQRDAIARAALAVLLEKGYHHTTLRDICKAAGISNGALYSYFPTRESVIVAACAIDRSISPEADLPETWEDYVRFPDDVYRPGTFLSKRLRLSLQFAADITQMHSNPVGLSIIYSNYRQRRRLSLLRLRERGIITMPLGADMTTELHTQMLFGAIYNLASNKDAAREPIVEACAQGLALTAGLKAQAAA